MRLDTYLYQLQLTLVYSSHYLWVAVLTETTFNWPGIGTYLVDKVMYRDYTAIQAVIILFAIIVGLTSLIVDILYALIDPRVRY